MSRGWLIAGGLVAAAAVAVLLYPYVAGAYYLEVGGRELEEARAFLAAHPDEVNPSLDRALRHFVRATEIEPRSGYAYRRLGQARLLLGDNDGALEALTRAAELRPHHPLIHVELGYAYDGLGRVERALAEYERGGYGPAVEEAIVNYLKLADWKAAAGGGDEALWILQKRVLKLDPDNLPALYREIKIYEGLSEQSAEELAGPLRERLRTFPAEKLVRPSEPRLATYWEQAMRALVEEGVWEEERTSATQPSSAHGRSG